MCLNNEPCVEYFQGHKQHLKQIFSGFVAGGSITLVVFGSLSWLAALMLNVSLLGLNMNSSSSELVSLRQTYLGVRAFFCFLVGGLDCSASQAFDVDGIGSRSGKLLSAC